jgi:bacillithiol system protein YtxJ
MNWIPLIDPNQLAAIIARSNSVPCLIFKHSTRCNISAIAKYRLEDDWNFPAEVVEPYYLDLLQFRNVSQAVSEQFQVYHESPQVLLISNGECVYDASHLDISVAELQESLTQLN